MDQSSKRLYTRYLSNVVRKWSPSSSVNNMTENPVFPVDGATRAVIITICRIRQRILTQAWSILVKNTGVKHDYEADARMILYRRIPDTELRTELEIEVLYKWVVQVKDQDPTGIANTIFMCKRKAVVYAALQQIRLEFYEPGETILFEGDIPRPEDGHFTVFKGECEVLQFPDQSVPLMKLLYLAKKKRWDDAKLLLDTAPIVARIPRLSGFGELSTLTGVKRAASIRMSPKMKTPGEILILPKEALLDCLKSRTTEGVEGAATSEAIDFLRQSGLANRISPKDLVSAASSMIRRTLLQGEILYYKGEKAKSIFLVVSGEFLLDTGDFMVDGEPAPFVRATNERCYHLTTGSILGEEGVVGDGNVYLSTAAVVSSAAVVFEAVSFGMNFLAEKVGGLRYSALYYRDKLCWDFAQPVAEQNNPYTFFNSLRKSISHMKPYRALESLASAACSEHRIQEQAKKIHSVKQAELKKQKLNRTGLFPGASNQVSGQQEKVEEDNPFLSYPRSLSGVGLHRAVDINKHVKKSLQNISRSHAKETILFEQLNRIPEEEKYDEDILHIEKLFEQNLKEYYDRCALQARKLKEEEELRRRNAATRASSAIRFFSTNSNGYVDSEDTPSDPSATGEETAQKTPFEIAREEAVKIASEAKSPTSLRRNRQSMVAEMNMAKLYSMDVIDPTTLHASKLEMYFQWVDSLTLMAHKNLLQQAEQTAEELHDMLHHDQSTHFLLGMKNADQVIAQTSVLSEEERWGELGKILQQYGLTPLDMTPQWMGKEHGDGIKLILPEDSEVKVNPTATNDNPEKMKTIEELPSPKKKSISGDEKKNKFKESRSGTSKSMKSVKSVKSEASKAKSTTTKNSDQGESPKKVVSYAAKEREEKLIKAHLESKYKSYTPSSWRDDMIQKKSQETTVAHVFHFTRSNTPDNRRTVMLHTFPLHRDNTGSHSHHHHHHVNLQQSPTEKKPTMLLSPDQSTHVDIKEVHSQNGEPASLVDYGQFIDEPEYFMTALKENPLDHIRRTKMDLDPWDTRFMNVRNPKRNSAGAELNKADEEAAAQQILNKVTLPQIVRTHLKENLQHYSRNEILTAAQRQLQNSETPFMRIIFGKELDTFKSSKSLRNSWNASRNTSFIDMDSGDGSDRRRRNRSPFKAAIHAAVAAVGWSADARAAEGHHGGQGTADTVSFQSLPSSVVSSSSVKDKPNQPVETPVGGGGVHHHHHHHHHHKAATHHSDIGKCSPSVISVATSEREYEADILRSLPTLGDAHNISATIRAPHSPSGMLTAAGDADQSILTMPSVMEERGDSGDTLDQHSVHTLPSKGGILPEQHLHPAGGGGDDMVENGSNAASSVAGEDTDRDDDVSTVAGEEATSSRRQSEHSLPSVVTATAAGETGAVPVGPAILPTAGVDAIELDRLKTDPPSAVGGIAFPSDFITVELEQAGTAVFSPTGSNTSDANAFNDANTFSSGNLGISRRSSPRRQAKAAAQKVYVRYTDTKPASNALQEFEHFMKAQDPQFTKAKAEGRKRANQKCKYRLAPSLRGDPELLAAAMQQQQQQQHQRSSGSQLTGSLASYTPSHTIATKEEEKEKQLQDAIDAQTTLGKDIHLRPKVSLKRIIFERLKSEVAVFQAMYPKATMSQRRSFIESFQQKYPESEITVQDFEGIAQSLSFGGGGRGGVGGGATVSSSLLGPPPKSPTAAAGGPLVFDFEKKSKVDVNDHIPIPMMTLAKKMMTTTPLTINTSSGGGGDPGHGWSAPRSPLVHQAKSKLVTRQGTNLNLHNHNNNNSNSRPGTSSSTSTSSPPPPAMSPKRGSLLRSSSMFMLDVAETAVTLLDDSNDTHNGAVEMTMVTDEGAHAIETHRSHDTHASTSTSTASTATATLVSPTQRRIEVAQHRRRHSLLMDATQAMLQMQDTDLLDTYEVEVDHDNAHIEDWQRYTIQCIVKEKTGERKILPSIATKKTMESMTVSGKRYRGESGGGYSLITLPSKQAEQPIDGPTSYMELYKKSFHIPTSRRMKEKIQKELKDMAKSLNY